MRLPISDQYRFEVIADYCSTMDAKRSLCGCEPPFGCLEATYAVYLRPIGKPVVDFLFASIYLFIETTKASKSLLQVAEK